MAKETQATHQQAEEEERRWQETLLALKSVKAGRTMPAEKMFSWIQSWGTENELPRPGVADMNTSGINKPG